jgi:hypothetical protein
MINRNAAFFAFSLCLLMAGYSLAETPEFTGRRCWPLPYYPYTTQVADMDGDGNLDALVMTSDDTLRVFRGTGEGDLVSWYSVSLDTTGVIAVADFTGDSHPDVALVGTNSSGLKIYPNTGDGTLGPAYTQDIGRSASFLYPVDIDGDGDMDAVVLHADADTVSIHLNNGSGILTKSTSFKTVPDLDELCIADLDGDGDLDMAIPCPGSNQLHRCTGGGEGSRR